MKKTAILVSILFVILLNACAPTSTPAPTTAKTSTPSEVPFTPTTPPTATSTPRPRVKACDVLGFLKGMSYVSWDPTNYSHPLSDQSLEALADTGTEWIALGVISFQNDRASLSIDGLIQEDEAVVHAIQTAHALDMNVMIKIAIIFENDPDGWGGSLGETFSPADWDA